MATTIFTTKGPKETQKLGERLGRKLTPPKIVALTSDLGGGKTTFIQGLAKGLGIKTRITSPTFVLERIYPLPKRKAAFYHYDLYRLEPDNLIIKEILENAITNIVAIEWAEKIKPYLPDSTVWIKITSITDDQRKFQIKNG